MKRRNFIARIVMGGVAALGVRMKLARGQILTPSPLQEPRFLVGDPRLALAIRERELIPYIDAEGRFHPSEGIKTASQLYAELVEACDKNETNLLDVDPTGPRLG